MGLFPTQQSERVQAKTVPAAAVRLIGRLEVRRGRGEAVSLGSVMSRASLGEIVKCVSLW